MRVKVSLMGDVCLPRPASMTIHDGLCFEMPTPMMWPPGLALQQNKLTSTVFHKTQFVVLEGHNCGYVIPHVTIPLTNPKLPLYIAFSSRKVMFSSSKVQANGAQVGCTEIGGAPVPIPMFCCGSPISVPNGFPSFNSLHTVSVGLSIGDIVAGFIAIASEMLGESLCERWGLKAGGLAGLAAKLLGASTLQEWALKQALGALSGCARIAATQEGKLNVEVGSGYARARASQEFTRDGHNTLGRIRLNAANEELGYAYIANPGGTTNHQWTGSIGTPVGSGSIQRTNTYGGGRLVEQKTRTTASGGAVNVHPEGPPDTATISAQHTSIVQVDGQAISTTADYAGSSSAAGSWGVPL